MTDERLWQVFLDVHRGLPRQGPGDEASTLRALKACGDLPAKPSILDVGCGPGMQTLVLARATGGSIFAVDLYREFLDQLERSAEEAGLADCIETVEADMTALPFPAASFDLVWSEGAAYSMGVAQALTAWKPLLKPGGCLAFTELVWLDHDPPEEAQAFFAEEYPPMTSIAANEALVRGAGYALLDRFTLPDSAWWEHYYGPLEAKLPAMEAKYAGDEKALGVIALTAREIDIRRRFGTSYDYVFFVARKEG